MEKSDITHTHIVCMTGQNDMPPFLLRLNVLCATRPEAAIVRNASHTYQILELPSCCDRKFLTFSIHIPGINLIILFILFRFSRFAGQRRHHCCRFGFSGKFSLLKPRLKNVCMRSHTRKHKNWHTLLLQSFA